MYHICDLNEIRRVSPNQCLQIMLVYIKTQNVIKVFRIKVCTFFVFLKRQAVLEGESRCSSIRQYEKKSCVFL